MEKYSVVLCDSCLSVCMPFCVLVWSVKLSVTSLTSVIHLFQGGTTVRNECVFMCPCDFLRTFCHPAYYASFFCLSLTLLHTVVLACSLCSIKTDFFLEVSCSSLF